MKISLNTLRFLNKHYGTAESEPPEGIDETVRRIGAQLGAIEEVAPFGEKYEGVLIVRVVSCEDHPDADRLYVCKIDDGGKAEDMERDENGHIQVVCGAPNVHADMLAVWLRPGQIVPSTYYDIDTFKLEARDIRGQKSNGMLASPKELGLSDNHEGIFEVFLDHDQHIEPGTLFNDACHAHDDVILDLENKMFTHRPDCFGYLGLAREVEGIHHRPYKSPEWYRTNPEIPGVEAEELPLEVRNETPELVPRFTAIAFRDVQVKPSPFWLQVDLARSGLRPINNIVDYTNWLMLVTGQPLHAYDYDKVKARSAGDKAVIAVRHPHENEKLTLLNGKELTPRQEAIMIATDKELIGVGGVMGGADTEVSEHTRNVIIECANFDMYSVRRTSMEHGLFTDAVTRFTKGQSPLQTLAAIGKITDEIRRYAGGKVASTLIDDNHVDTEVIQRDSLHPPVALTRQFVNERLGLDLSADDMHTLLTNVEFEVELDGDTLTVKAPFWRGDIAIREDVVEEIGRLHGYDHLPVELPVRSITPAAKNDMLELKTSVRETLSKAGANEVLTYSFVHGNLLDKVGQSRDQAFKLANALSPDLQYYRLSLTPNLLEKVHPNIKAGHDQFALFEIGRVHGKSEVDHDGLPAEFTNIALVFSAEEKTAKQRYGGAPYYQARKYLTNLLAGSDHALKIKLEPLGSASFEGHALTEQTARLFEPSRAAVIVYQDRIAGIIGEYKRSVQKALKLPAFTAGFELYSWALTHGSAVNYVQFPRFPKVEQDICLKVPAGLAYAELFRFVWEHLDENRPDQTYHDLGPVDIYQRQDDQAHKQVTLRLRIASYERTLTDDEVNNLLERVAAEANEKLGAERI